jgi:hypothetical protein
MGCNCGKNRRQQAVAKPVTPPPQPPAQPTASGATQRFSLLEDSGRTQTFGSRLEADAARARHGGSISVIG